MSPRQLECIPGGAERPRQRAALDQIIGIAGLHPAAEHPRQRAVLNDLFVARLAEANRAARQLRAWGCRVLRMDIDDATTEVVIDRNPHRRIDDCPNVRVTVSRHIPHPTEVV
jgi:hypothetical protein